MIFFILISLLTALTAGIWSFIFQRWPVISKKISFCSLGISGVTSAIAGINGLLIKTPLFFAFHFAFYKTIWLFKIDPLSGFFLTLVGIIVISVAIYGPSYLAYYEKNRPANRLMFFTGLFITSMYIVLLANDVFSFMLAWELMSLSSYFLVAYHHEQSANRSAALLYLIMAHASGLLLLCAFAIFAKFSQNLSFAALQNIHLSPTLATITFLLALSGFAMKAGLVPLHVWLPRAHPVAPSHISALMSGVMLKIAVYGFLRFVFDLLHEFHWQWGILVLVLGTVSAILGVLYALMQHDLKKLLAYHSVENLGIIFIGIGLSIIFFSTNHPLAGVLGLIAALYHSLNHALFKSLLFLGAGSILQGSREHDLEKMGGLIHKMPYTALFFLVGCISISALPPFNGFVSEWLTFQTALQATTLQSGIIRTLIPISATLLALTGALAAACFVKVYAIAFLGQPRTPQVKQANEISLGMKIAMAFLALPCLAFGILPVMTINLINNIPLTICGIGLPKINNWLWLIPIAPQTASYSAILVLLAIVAIWLLSYWLIKMQYKNTRREIVKPWACGFGTLTSRMQYTATAFAMPIRRVFQDIWLINERVEKTNSELHYSLHIEDRFWKYCYEPLERGILQIGHFISRIQGGNIRVYLAYMFFTVIILLAITSYL